MQRHCEMCGAKEGQPHHDPIAHGKPVRLHRSRVVVMRGRLQSIICTLCRNGGYAWLRELRGK